MTPYPFRPGQGPITVEASVTGPARGSTVTMILDTGATTSLLKRTTLAYLGFDLTATKHQVRMTTGSTVELVPVVQLTRLFALGQNRIGFSVVAHSLPEGVAVDGLLGLDFFRGHVLTLDFRAGSITLG